MSVSRETLERLTREHGLPATAAAALERLLDVLAAERNPPTTVVAPDEAVNAHVADSLSGLAVPALREAHSIADIGSGAGFPGLPLAVALPDAAIDLIESTGRKCEVIERLINAAGVSNARPVCARVEEWAAGDGAAAYAAATARALAPLAVLCEYAVPLLVPGGALVCWKGARDPAEEEAGAAAAAQAGLEPAEVRAVEPFPGARNRHLHVFVKVTDTPDRLPRRPGVARRRPLGR